MKAITDWVRQFARRVWLVLTSLAMVASSYAQPNFGSGSTGSDGALNLTTPGTILFDPTSFNPPLNPKGDNIYNFTTINIGAGVIVRLSGRNLNGPLYWLATGNVTIAGTIDLNGENGAGYTNTESARVVAYPGAGGYAGGVGGGRSTIGTVLAPQPGSGPGGGAAGNPAVNQGNAAAGTFTSNTFLVPLVGGSGGGGGNSPFNDRPIGAGGGAGGGAILIASSTSIAITGLIRANGGAAAGEGSGGGGPGAGGAIRLTAPSISGTGTLQAARVRLETANYQGPTNISQPFTVTSTPNLFLPTTPPGSLRITSIGGASVPVNPTGSFTVPDVNINSTSAVSVVVEAHNIPVGTVVNLQFFDDGGADFSVNTLPLSGTLATSTATASVTFPPGFSRGYAKATW
jgi:hypothetical protein